MRALLRIVVVALLFVGCANSGDEKPADTTANGAPNSDANNVEQEPTPLRLATYNASLFRTEAGALVAELDGGESQQAKDFARVVQEIRPDIILVNEVDWDEEGRAADLLAEQYLAVSQGEAEPIEYPHRYVPPTNTGLHSGVDLDGNGAVVSEPGSQDYGNDAFGFGTFHGQYGFIVLSRHPIVTDEIRTFQELRWADMPDNLLPTDYYSPAAVEVLRLSSKNHVDVPVEVDGERIHLLGSHPTPPSFDGDEDRNGRRNHDEIRFWVDYITGGEQASWIVDDAGVAGGIEAGTPFWVAGDLNSDPNDGDSRRGALLSLLNGNFAQDPTPASEGAVVAAESEGGANTVHEGDPAYDTANFSDGRVGNLRVDYVLPAPYLEFTDSGVFWPPPSSELAPLTGVSDHHLVWVDVAL